MVLVLPSVAQKEIGRVRLSDSVVSLINNQSKCIIACLANGTIALIKSKNSLWDFSTSAIKIIDFGSSVDFSQCEMHSLQVGTSYYIAPEVIKKNYNYN